VCCRHNGLLHRAHDDNAAGHSYRPDVNSPVYRFGPESFVFAAPVEISIPVNGTADPGNVGIYRINPPPVFRNISAARTIPCAMSSRRRPTNFRPGSAHPVTVPNTAWGA